MAATRTVHRHLVGLPQGQGLAFLSWRLLTTDRPDAHFYVQRRGGSGTPWQRVSVVPGTCGTCTLDRTPLAATYDYRICSDDGTPSETVQVETSAPPSLVARAIALDPEAAVEGIALGDLENDGRLGYIVRCTRAGTVWIAAYGHGGTLLWEIDTRLPAQGGWDGSTLHVPFLAWDVDGNSRTEVAFHAYDGTYPLERYSDGIPGEVLAVVDAETGALVWKADWPAGRSRVMMTVGHLRGFDRPADIVVLDGTYGDVTLTAIDGLTGQVRWRIEQSRPAGHNLDIGDLDEAGTHQVICGGTCYDGNGQVRWQAEPFGHTDISKPAKIDPGLAGLQVWYAVESHNPGVYLVDKAGNTIFKEPFRHAHYGWVARHAPNVSGLHPHTAEDARRGTADAPHFPIFLPDGSHWLNLTDWQRKNFVPVHWDQGAEVVFVIRKENKRVVRLLPSGDIEDLANGKLPEGGRYGRNLACADVIGDHRENIVTVDEDDHRLIVLANATVAHHRGCSPYDDFAYRHDRSQHGSGYYVYLSPPDTVVHR